MESNFYRGGGGATEQGTRLTDKEKKLLREMKFEKQLEIDIDIKKVNIDVIKPWITTKLTSLLGMEDDVVNEYVFSQLEQKQLNPKIMQINLTGFLNARRARQFMGELWELLIEAQNTKDGIPMSLVQKKIEELKASDQKPDDAVAIDLKDTSSNWNNRYQSLTYGKYQPKLEVDVDDEPPRRRSVSPSKKGTRNRDRSRSPRRKRERERDRSPEKTKSNRSRSPIERKPRREREPERKRSRTPERRKPRREREEKGLSPPSEERKIRRRRSSSSPERKPRREKERSRSPKRRRDRDRSNSHERKPHREREPERKRSRSPKKSSKSSHKHKEKRRDDRERSSKKKHRHESDKSKSSSPEKKLSELSHTPTPE